VSNYPQEALEEFPRTVWGQKIGSREGTCLERGNITVKNEVTRGGRRSKRPEKDADESLVGCGGTWEDGKKRQGGACAPEPGKDSGDTFA